MRERGRSAGEHGWRWPRRRMGQHGSASWLGPLRITMLDPAMRAVLARYSVLAREQDGISPFRPTIHGPLLVIPSGCSVRVDRMSWACAGGNRRGKWGTWQFAADGSVPAMGSGTW